MSSVSKYRTLKSEIGKQAVRDYSQAVEDFVSVYEKLQEMLSKPRSALALLNPNLPETLERWLCTLANTLLGGTAWSITLGGRDIGSGGLFSNDTRFVQESLEFASGSFLRFTVAGPRLRSQAGEFQILAARLTEITFEYQKKLFGRLLPGGERVADDDVYHFLWPAGNAGGTVHLLNLSHVRDSDEMTMTRLLSGPETARQLIGRLTSEEILRRDILAGIDLVLSWNFPFQSTNTYKAFKAAKDGRPTSYFPNWWAVGSESYSNPNTVLANTLRRGMQSNAVFGESNYLLAPFQQSNRRALTLVARGALQSELEGEARDLSVEPRLIERLALPGRLGYELYDHWLQQISHEIARNLSILSESPHLFRKEPEINWQLVNLLKAALEDGSGWSVNPETSHGAGEVAEGRPDLLLRYSLRPELTLVGECKQLENVRAGLEQLSRYVGPTTDAALLIAYQLHRRRNAWDTLRSQLMAAAAVRGLGLEPILGVPIPNDNGAVWQGVTWLHVQAEPVKSVPLRVFLVDLAR
jgi:hypothetical protein